MDSRFLVILSIVAIFAIGLFGFLYYQQAYTQNCENGGGSMTGILQCSVTLSFCEKGLVQQNDKCVREINTVDVVIPLGASNPETQKNYVPNNILVVIGVNNTVTWINEDDVSSSIVSNDDLFDSGLIRPKSTWVYTFDTEGFYGYHSVPHPWMKGMVIVESQNNKVNSTYSREITVLSIYPENVTLPDPKPKAPVTHDGLIQE